MLFIFAWISLDDNPASVAGVFFSRAMAHYVLFFIKPVSASIYRSWFGRDIVRAGYIVSSWTRLKGRTTATAAANRRFFSISRLLKLTRYKGTYLTTYSMPPDAMMPHYKFGSMERILLTAHSTHTQWKSKCDYTLRMHCTNQHWAHHRLRFYGVNEINFSMFQHLKQYPRRKDIVFGVRLSTDAPLLLNTILRAIFSHLDLVRRWCCWAGANAISKTRCAKMKIECGAHNANMT